MELKTKLQILIGILGYCVWALMAYLDPSVRPNFLNFNIGLVVGTFGLALRDMPTRSQGSTDPISPLQVIPTSNGQTPTP